MFIRNALEKVQGSVWMRDATVSRDSEIKQTVTADLRRPVREPEWKTCGTVSAGLSDGFAASQLSGTG